MHGLPGIDVSGDIYNITRVSLDFHSEVILITSDRKACRLCKDLWPVVHMHRASSHLKWGRFLALEHSKQPMLMTFCMDEETASCRKLHFSERPLHWVSSVWSVLSGVWVLGRVVA